MKSLTSRNSRRVFSTGTEPFFYYITDSDRLSGIPLDTCIRRALQWGVDFIQVREKNLSDKDLYERVRQVVGLAEGTQCRILVNGRADIALAAGAHGAHLPSTGLRVSDIRSWLPDDFLVGISAHTEEEILQAGREHADYALLGHVFPTASKTGLGAPVGLELLRRACLDTPLPVFGLGGINAGRIESVLKAGAIGVAGISLFQKNREFGALTEMYPSNRRSP
jgi:thiamine-phosphate diphosphorylase